MSQKQAGETAAWSFHKHEKLTMEMYSAPNAIQLFEEEGKKKKKPFRQGLSPAVLKGEKKARRQEGGRRA